MFNPVPVGRDRIQAMDGLRAYAVSLVFCVHFFGHYYDRTKGIDFDSFDYTQAGTIFDLIGYYFASSHYGVDLFFLLSGFLICRMVAHRDFNYISFLRNRLIRLYPAFAVALVLHLAYAAYFWDKIFDPWTVIQNGLFLIGIWELKVSPIIVPTWSLTYEWLFYLLFPLAMLLFARKSSFSAWQIAACAVLTIAAVAPLNANYTRFVMFFVGAALACTPKQLLQQWTKVVPDAAVILICAIINLAFVLDRNYYHFIWPFALASALLTIKTVHGEGWLSRVFRFQPLRTLGAISYSFFLLHGLALIIVVDHLGLLTVNVPEPLRILLLASISFLVATVAAALSFFLFERPYFQRRIQEFHPVHALSSSA